MKYDTLILHNGNEIDETTGALSIPVYNASTFHQKDPSVRQAYDYSRSGNPTRAGSRPPFFTCFGNASAIAFFRRGSAGPLALGIAHGDDDGSPGLAAVLLGAAVRSDALDVAGIQRQRQG